MLPVPAGACGGLLGADLGKPKASLYKFMGTLSENQIH